MIVLKLGGSVITRKEAATPTLNQENLERISEEIRKSSINEELVIIHGAGSFGHPPAQKYQIGAPIKSQEELQYKRTGFSITQQSVKDLNHRVCSQLNHAGVATVSISPSSFITTHNKRIKDFDTKLIQDYLNLGLVPVLYGDVVLDYNEQIKMAVLSGDQILQYLALNLGANQVILGTDVDGIFDRNPKTNPEAQLIPRVSSLDELEIEGSHSVDVTGGMQGKLAELLELAERGVCSQIINLNQPGILEKALRGEEVRGTRIERM